MVNVTFDLQKLPFAQDHYPSAQGFKVTPVRYDVVCWCDSKNKSLSYGYFEMESWQINIETEINQHIKITGLFIVRFQMLFGLTLSCRNWFHLFKKKMVNYLCVHCNYSTKHIKHKRINMRYLYGFKICLNKFVYKSQGLF